MKYRLIALLLLLHTFGSRADVEVLTQHNDLSRTGANLQETVLNTSNVNSNQFGLIFHRAVDDQIYGQPLIVTNVEIAGKGRHNLLLVATVNDSVYAFDADDASAIAAYWHTNFLGRNILPVARTDMTDACQGHYTDFSGNIGIVGTPVIDPGHVAIYMVARTKRVGKVFTTFIQTLHALDIRTGAERPNSPVVIEATCLGEGDGSFRNVLKFNSQTQNQRAGLAFVNGVVYIAWTSHCDWTPYHGWLIGYDATTMQRVVLYNTTPDGYDGGIWMSGQAPSADEDGNLYVTTGNGSVGTAGSPRSLINRGESLLKLTRSRGSLNVTSWFTPFNWPDLEAKDNDFGSSGVLLIPGTKLTLSGSKEGKLYLACRDRMGGLSWTNVDTNIVQNFQVTATEAPNNIHGAPVWWDGPNGSFCYVWGESDYLRQYQFNRTDGRFVLPNYAQSRTRTPVGMPGGFLSLSSNGTNAGTGILWASHQLSGDANQQVRPGILHAYDAENVGTELWNSEMSGTRDSVGDFAKFVPPTIANGKVYLATFSGSLNVYGLIRLSPKSPHAVHGQ